MGHLVTHTRHEQVVYLTLNRAGDGNRLDHEMAAELTEACDDVEDADVAVVVIRAAGGTFCDGLASNSNPEDLLGRYNPVEAVAALTRPVIAVVEGRAQGVGAELVLAADFRLLSSTASLSFPEIATGRLPTFGATQRLPRLVGRTRAIEILLLGREVGAAEALEIGLASRVAPAADLDTVVEELAGTLARHGPLALALAKEAVLRAGDLPLADGMRLEEDLYVLLQTTDDRGEGVRSFLDKRAPRFRGR